MTCRLAARQMDDSALPVWVRHNLAFREVLPTLINLLTSLIDGDYCDSLQELLVRRVRSLEQLPT